MGHFQRKLQQLKKITLGGVVVKIGGVLFNDEHSP
jgi:hypothetical protein